MSFLHHQIALLLSFVFLLEIAALPFSKRTGTITSSPPKKYMYQLDQENEGYFKGQWYNTSARIFNRSRAILRKRQCDGSGFWRVNRFLDTSVELSTERQKRLSISPGDRSRLCKWESKIEYIRDERSENAEEFTFNNQFFELSQSTAIYVRSEDAFPNSETYPVNKEVVWQFNTQGQAVQGYFIKFDLNSQSASGDGGDYISIHNNNGAKLVFRGEDGIDKKKVFLFSNSATITVKFMSNQAGTGTGFELFLNLF